MTTAAKLKKLIALIWEIRDKDLRFHYERHEVGDVLLPLVVLRRLDLVMAPTKAKVLAKAANVGADLDASADLLAHTAGQSFYNTSRFDFETLVTQDADAIADNMHDYLLGFSPNVREIIAKFGFTPQVERMAEADVLLRVVGKFVSTTMDLSPSNLSNMEMGLLYEELLRLSSDLSNKEAGDHFTPREVIHMMASLLVSDTSDLHKSGRVFTVCDPTSGTGGMLTEAEKRLLELNPQGRVHLFGQEIQNRAWAVCTSDMLIKGQDVSHIVLGDTLAKDGFPDQHFDYLIANPPYGYDWSESAKNVKAEAARGAVGRFPGGTPSKTDGQLLFLQHMVSKTKTADEGGGRVAVVLNASPLFSGDAGSGESDIRKWLFENDYIEAIIALPDQMFYNTGIYTYVWILSTAKRPERQGMVQLIDARDLYAKMPKSLGNKRSELTATHTLEIVSLYESFVEGPRSLIMRNEEFGYTKVIVERPLRRRYVLNDETRERIAMHNDITKLADDKRLPVLDAVAATGDFETTSYEQALTVVEGWAAKAGRVTKALREVLLAGMAIIDPAGDPVPDGKGGLKADSSLRDAEYVPLVNDIDAFIATKVLPYAPDAWAAPNGKVG